MSTPESLLQMYGMQLWCQLTSYNKIGSKGLRIISNHSKGVWRDPSLAYF